MSLCAIGTAHVAPRTLWIAPSASAMLARIARMPTARLAIGFHLVGGACGSPLPCACPCETEFVEHTNHVPGKRSDLGSDWRGLPWPFGRGLGALIYTQYLIEAGPLGAWLDLGPRACPHLLGQPPCPRLGGELDLVA